MEIFGIILQIGEFGITAAFICIFSTRKRRFPCRKQSDFVEKSGITGIIMQLG